jgi:hypothetical protein
MWCVPPAEGEVFLLTSPLIELCGIDGSAPSGFRRILEGKCEFGEFVIYELEREMAHAENYSTSMQIGGDNVLGRLKDDWIMGGM